MATSEVRARAGFPDGSMYRYKLYQVELCYSLILASQLVSHVVWAEQEPTVRAHVDLWTEGQALVS